MASWNISGFKLWSSFWWKLWKRFRWVDTSSDGSVILIWFSSTYLSGCRIRCTMNRCFFSEVKTLNDRPHSKHCTQFDTVCVIIWDRNSAIMPVEKLHLAQMKSCLVSPVTRKRLTGAVSLLPALDLAAEFCDCCCWPGTGKSWNTKLLFIFFYTLESLTNKHLFIYFHILKI